ncbi:50S ribosomal protein L3 [Sulfuracidifex tepidarius]|uniref:Large ribosomal subunit protein uL3 n=1 Tax=Sulfuracidifex tepidarius TaxID=1294262 RepID=A0A510DVZ8_9CREN|nr:50S ribosomal protein L3 [Sulfuracidifex tepidarius]BBG24402.1 50S ribosomal protein L3 [Sulfuracidifex tepidarius]BBG27160.1 50S ribosomal protein L3 [Sulfuracidifex tepidarius]
MGHRKLSSPRRGSAGLRPRKRSSEFLPTPRSWPSLTSETPTLMGFIGYKAGMTHIYMVNDKQRSETFGKEIFVPVTVIETPPIVPMALRVYTPKGNIIGEYWAQDLPKDLNLQGRMRHFKVDAEDNNKSIEKIKQNIEKAGYIRIVAGSITKNVKALGKKVPDVSEIQVGGGNINSQLDYVMSILGKTVEVDSVFKVGQLIDVIGVTKGKGFQGVVKRYSTVELPRWHKHRKGSRKAGTKGPSLGTPSYTPQPGQMGFHRRTSYNKRILKISSDPNEINPAGGFVNYGFVSGKYVVVKGSVQGSKKRPLFLRYPIRPFQIPAEAPQVTYIDIFSKQG